MSLATPQKILAVDIGIPHLLLAAPLSAPGRNRIVVTPDKKKFLGIVPLEQKPANRINVIVNWPSWLTK